MNDLTAEHRHKRDGCEGPCANGYCVGFSDCVCEDGWTGTICDTGMTLQSLQC